MKEKSEKISLSIFIFCLVALATLSLLAFSGGLTGKSITEIGKDKVLQNGANKVSCTDSDNGQNYLIKGNTKYCGSDDNCFTKEDSCSGKTIVEQFCENNQAIYIEHECEVDCYEGTCVTLAKKFEYANKGDGGGGGGGGSESTTTSTTNANSETAKTYNIGALTSEQTLELSKNENIRFIIGTMEYTLTLKNFDETQATITTNNAQKLILTVGDKQNIDLNDDGVAEIYAKARALNVISGKIKMTIGPA